MTAEEWLTGADPHPMLEFLRGTADDRKLRLFAAACSRRVWNLIDPLGRTAVEVAENFADGLVEPDELRAARLACQGGSGQASWYAAATKPEVAARNAARSAQAGVAGNPLLDAEAAECLAQAALLRDIFGTLPFRAGSVEPSWLMPTVLQLARAIYHSRAFADLPRLADALEEAGCADAAVLGHCRQPGEHVRGCWVVDLILGKQPNGATVNG